MKFFPKTYTPLFFIVVVSLAMALVGRIVPEDTIRSVMHDAGSWGVVLLIFCLWITNVVAPLSGSPFLFAGFYLYGQISVFYAFIAAVIASISNFWIARIWGRGIVVKLAGEESLKKIDHLSKNYGVQTLFVFRLFLKEFHDVISYAYGLTNISFKDYFMVSTAGMIPATVVWYAISLTIRNPITFTIMSWLMAYISLLTVRGTRGACSAGG